MGIWSQELWTKALRWGGAHNKVLEIESEAGSGDGGVVSWDKADKGKSRPDFARELCFWLLCWGPDLTLQLLSLCPSAILITSKGFLLPGR